ncbi:MAG: hypothetical protein UD961_04205 [Bacteroidales bacterium]|nr:hypothetical protein [Bacteroidales bacterium]
MRKLITILIITLAAISCGKIKDAHNTLNDIETFINERPDSALTILNSFDTSLLDHKSIWAHHSLLHAQAKDKCYIDETNDSLMTQVVNYYEGKRDKEKLFKAYYYLGRIQYNAGDYATSMLSYTKAEQLIDEIDDDFIKGLLYAQLGMLHQKYYDYPRSLDAFNTAAKHYELARKTAHKYFAKLNIGQVYQELKDYTAAEVLLSEVMSWSYENDFIQLCQEALEFLITLYDETDQEAKISSLTNSVYADYCGSSLQVIQIRAYELSKQNNASSIDMLNEADAYLQHTVDTISNYYYKYRVHKQFGQYKEALFNHEQMINVQDAQTSTVLKHPLLSIKNDYIQAENKYMQLKVKMHKTQKHFAIIILCISICCITIYFRRRILEKNTEMLGYIEVATDLEKTLIEKCQEIESISNNLGVIGSELKTSEGYISEIFYKQYELLNKLTSTYYETHVCNKDMEAIYKQVSLEIERLSSDKKAISQLENFVNRYRRNIMNTIRTHLPDLTNMDYRLLCYLCAGFSAKAISIFTGDSTNNIYVKKSRIKDAILKLKDEKVKRDILEALTIR